MQSAYFRYLINGLMCYFAYYTTLFLRSGVPDFSASDFCPGGYGMRLRFGMAHDVFNIKTVHKQCVSN